MFQRSDVKHVYNARINNRVHFCVKCWKEFTVDMKLLYIIFKFLTLLIVYHTLAQETTATSNFYTELLKRNSRRCQVYNGTVCAPYLTGKVVLTEDGNSISVHEKKLKKWFKQSKESGEISRECRPHAEALTCMHVFQDCEPVSKKSTKPTLCSAHCRLLKRHICKGEYKRVIYSDYMQQFLPLCEEISIIDDSNGEFCYFLPTFNMSLGPEPYAESIKSIRRQAGQTAILKCGFGIRNFLWSDKNLDSITDGTWYKGPKRIVWSKRMNTRTKQKGKARLFMMLKIRNISKKDHGKYRCVISFANKTITNYAELSVYPGAKSIGPVIVEKLESNRNTPSALANGNSLSNNDQQPTIKELMEGTCVPYGKGICEPFFHESIGTEYVFEDANQRLDLVNKQLEGVINGLIKSDKLSARCIEFGRPVLCYNRFFKCQNATGRISHSLCKRDCELFKDVYCKKELEMIAMEKGILSLYIPQCDKLPDSDAHCISISPDSKHNNQNEVELQKNAIHSQVIEMRCYDENSSINYMGSLSMSRNGKMCDNWNMHTNFQKVNHAYCRNFGESKPWCFVNGIKEYCSIKPCPREVTDPKCYTGSGEYYGQQSISKSGRRCITWNKVYQYSNLDHSYCRNYGKDRTEPWCYVDINTAESCGIPKCIAPEEVTKGKVSLVAYIVPPVIVSSIIVFSLILFIFYFRNKKILTSTSTPIKVSQEEVIDVAVVGTISTTASYEFKSESSVEEKSPQLVTKRIKRCRKNTPEVKEDHLVNLQKIGDGNMGQLWKGDYVKSRHLLIPVLVRKLRFDTASSVVSEFRQEMNLLRCLKHRNFQQVACVSAMSEVPFIAFECYHTQDLKEYLKVNVELSLENIISCIYQICSGLDYLHGSKVIVKDLAARNCFISADNVVQISMCGLGMSRYPEDYRYIPALGLAPVRWLAPETLQTGIHSYATDIHMLGVALWEIFSLGQQPFDDCLDEELFILNREELLLLQPDDCPTQVWNIIKSCWSCPTSYRPCAGSMKQKFKHIHSKMKHAVEPTMT